MKIIKNCTLVLFMILSIITLVACNDAYGGLSINETDTVVGGTIFDTKNLKLVKSDITGEINYSVKVIGYTTPLDDQMWDKWFGDETPDIAGKIAVCLRLKYSDDIASDPNATITLPASTSNDETKTYKISEVTDGSVDNNYIYLILNPKHDIVNINVDYTINKEHKDITYQIDMISVNSDSERLE